MTMMPMNRAVALDHGKGIAFPYAFHKPHHDGAAHDPRHMEVGGHGFGELLPVRWADGGEVLPRIVQNAHVVVHGHEIDEQAEAERAEPDAETAHGLAGVGPGLPFKGDNPGGADPGGDDGEHHAGLGRVFRGIEVGEAELHELFGIEIGKGEVAEHAFKEAVDEEDHRAYGNEGQHDALLKRMRGADPVFLEGPEVEGVRHPDKDDEPPAAVIIAHIGSIEAHDAARVLENPPGHGENHQRERQVHQRGNGAVPSFDELSLLKIRKLFLGHEFLLEFIGGSSVLPSEGP